MHLYWFLKYLHIIGAAVLLGTGAGIAFFMLLGHRTGKPATVAAIARIVVIADVVFTATVVAAQPATGALLAWNMGFSLKESWIALSIGLYLVTAAFWLPVVWMQIRMRDLACGRRTLISRFRPSTTGFFAGGSPLAFRLSQPCWPSSGS